MNNEEKILSLLEKHSTILETLVTKVDSLEQGQAHLRQDVDGLKQGQARLEQRQARLEQRQASLEQGQARLESELADTKRHVIAMELDQGKQLGALFDGYALTRDILTNEIRPDVADIKSRIDNHHLRILRLEPDKKKSS